MREVGVQFLAGTDSRFQVGLAEQHFTLSDRVRILAAALWYARTLYGFSFCAEAIERALPGDPQPPRCSSCGRYPPLRSRLLTLTAQFLGGSVCGGTGDLARLLFARLKASLMVN